MTARPNGVRPIWATLVDTCLMSEILPESRALSGFVMAVEGLAVWVVAIFLQSLRETGWIVWPSEDMYTTAVGTMHAWLTSGPAGVFELLAYFGLVVAVGGPAWFWMTKPGLEIIERWTTEGRSSEPRSPTDDGRQWEDGDWIPATETAADPSSPDGNEDLSGLFSSTFERASSEPDSAKTALASGDFLRGSTGDAGDSDPDDS